MNLERRKERRKNSEGTKTRTYERASVSGSAITVKGATLNAQHLVQPDSRPVSPVTPAQCQGSILHFHAVRRRSLSHFPSTGHG